MGEIRKTANEKLVIGILTSDTALYKGLKERFTGLWGPVDYESGPVEFSFTSYYDNEMGTPITRYFLSFKNLIPSDSLANVKTMTNAFEADYSVFGKRKVNLDPGTLNQSRFVLASTKDSSHRVSLPGGIFAEITLMFEHGTFRPLEWTYADYRSQGYLHILNKIRELYRLQVKAGEHLQA
ncbi:MAG: DUF4416 family protein [Spirochaetaceae bacterium]|nr:MAG: DUF4416 family protein [Spirochaetaceae bacterium]